MSTNCATRLVTRFALKPIECGSFCTRAESAMKKKLLSRDWPCAPLISCLMIFCKSSWLALRRAQAIVASSTLPHGRGDDFAETSTRVRRTAVRRLRRAVHSRRGFGLTRARTQDRHPGVRLHDVRRMSLEVVARDTGQNPIGSCVEPGWSSLQPPTAFHRARCPPAPRGRRRTR